MRIYRDLLKIGVDHFPPHPSMPFDCSKTFMLKLATTLVTMAMMAAGAPMMRPLFSTLTVATKSRSLL